jgi:hypothetical protein
LIAQPPLLGEEGNVFVNFISLFLLQFREPARAIAELGFVDTEHIENAQQ